MSVLMEIIREKVMRIRVDDLLERSDDDNIRDVIKKATLFLGIQTKNPSVNYLINKLSYLQEDGQVKIFKRIVILESLTYAQQRELHTMIPDLVSATLRAAA